MEIKNNEDGSCYANECNDKADWLAVGVPVQASGMSLDGSKTEYWNMMLCAAHGQSVKMTIGCKLVGPGVIMIEGES